MTILYKSASDLREKTEVAREVARSEAKENFAFVQSRGTWLCTESSGDQCQPAPEADCPTWDRTLKSIDRLIVRVLQNYPEVTHVVISGGYDGAASPHAFFKEDDYEPWASSWRVVVWQRNTGGSNGKNSQ